MEKISFDFPFQKIDRNRRIVSGIATADNIDPSGDLVKYEASLEAFNKWVGNIREMHGKNAVGKSMGYRPVTVAHEGKIYRGIEVDAYVSKGAEDTWQKILDGTLKGFSIGGNVIEKTTEYDSQLKQSYRLISKYSLGELSLVDNPCNPAATFSMIKMADDGVLEDVLNKARYTIYYCEADKVAKADSGVCSNCEVPMVEIGFADEFNVDIVEKMINDFEMQKGGQMEKTDQITKAMCESCDEEIPEGEDHTCKTEKSVDLQNNDLADTFNNMTIDTDAEKVSILKTLVKGVFSVFGVDTEAETVVEKAVEVAEEIGGEEIEKSEASEEVVEKSDGGSEVNTDELLASLTTLLDTKIEEINKSVDAKIDAIQKSVDDTKAATDEALAEVTEKVTSIDEASAVKKSVDETDNKKDEKVEKTSFWGNTFVPADIVEVLGYDS